MVAVERATVAADRIAAKVKYEGTLALLAVRTAGPAPTATATVDGAATTVESTESPLLGNVAGVYVRGINAAGGGHPAVEVQP